MHRFQPDKKEVYVNKNHNLIGKIERLIYQSMRYYHNHIPGKLTKKDLQGFQKP